MLRTKAFVMIDFVKQITKEAGKLLLSGSKTVVGKKAGTGNWVTRADLASERHLITSIQKKYPAHRILAEETLSQMENPVQEDHLWIVDPLDGTGNYSFSTPFYCVSVAYAARGEIQAAAIYDPIRDELFWAEKDNGSYCNHSRIWVDRRKTFSSGLVGLGFPYQKENIERTYPVGPLFHQAGARVVILGSAALQCAYVACGRLSLYYEWGLKPYDLAAAKLIVEEAGGVMDSVSVPFTLFPPRDAIVGNNILVAKTKNFVRRVI